jgi:putative AlgH/UPF0301 family transcriptional regulator
MLVDNLQGFCLVASEKLKYNSYFSDSLVFIYESNNLCSKGLVINKGFDLKKDCVNEYTQKVIDFACKNSLELLRSGPIAADCCFTVKKNECIDGFEVVFMDYEADVSNKTVCLGFGNVVWSQRSFLDDIANGNWNVFDIGEVNIFDVPLTERFKYAKDSIGFSSDCLFAHKTGNV